MITTPLYDWNYESSAPGGVGIKLRAQSTTAFTHGSQYPFTEVEVETGLYLIGEHP